MRRRTATSAPSKTERIEGSRLHIGLIFPSPIPPRLVKEFYEVVPDGIDVTAVTLRVQHLGDDHIREAGKGIEQACKQLAAYDVDLVYFLGVPPIVLQGPGFHRQLADRMSQASGVPALTDLCGVLEAMQHLNIRKIALATPFEQVVNERIKVYLEAEGIGVSGASCLGMNKNAEIRRLPIRIEYDLARKTYLESSPRADGIYIACGSWGSIHNVSRLEQDFDTQVVTWMNAFMWACMRRRGVTDRIQGFGKLLGSLPAMSSPRGRV